MAEVATLAGDRNVVCEGDQIMLQRENVLKVFQARKQRTVWYERTKFTLDAVIGQPWGSMFDATSGKLVKIQRPSSDVEKDETEMELEQSRDNRNLVDNDGNQKLTREDIHSLKKEGATGQDVVDHLIENSATFSNKTDFAQQKYIKKKKKKHTTEFTVLKPSTRLLAKMYYSKGPAKICNLRIDAISQLLTYSNIHAGSRVMVADGCLGLVVGAIMDRMQGFGEIVQFYTGTAPVRSAIENFDFPKSFIQKVHGYPIDKLSLVRKLEDNKDNSVKKDSAAESTEESSKTETGLESTQTKTETKSETSGKTQNETETAGNGEVSMDTTENAATENTSTENAATESAATESASTENASTESAATENTSTENASTESAATENASTESAATENASTESAATENTATEGAADKSEVTNAKDNTAEKKVGDAQKESDKNGQLSKLTQKRQLEDEQRDEKRAAKQAAHARTEALLLEKNMDALVVALRCHPTPVVIHLIRYLAPSRPFAIFSAYKEPLLDCYMQLRDNGGVINLRLTETWLRNYQVLSNRTHPEINMSSSGGYLLIGTTVKEDTA